MHFFEDHFGQAMTDGPELLRNEAAEFPHVSAYVKHLGRWIEPLPLGAAAHDIATLIEPVDRSAPQLSRDPDLRRTFVHGSYLGLRVVYEFMPILAQRYMEDVTVVFDFDETADEIDQREVISRGLVELSESGARLAETYEPLLEEWEYDLAPNICHQPYLRRGLGFVIYTAHEAWDKYQADERTVVLDRLERDPDSLFDWNELDAILGGEQT